MPLDQQGIKRDAVQLTEATQQPKHIRSGKMTGRALAKSWFSEAKQLHGEHSVIERFVNNGLRGKKKN